MFRTLLITGLLAVCLGLPAQGLAQVTPAQRAVAPHLSTEARTRLVEGDTLTRFRTRRAPYARVDVETGVTRALYRVAGAARYAAAAPETAARRFLTAQSAAFGWAEAAADLHLTSVRRTPYSSHVVYQQTYRGLPVYNRFVKVNLDRTNRPVMVFSGYAPTVQDLDTRPSLSADAAAARAAEAVSKQDARTDAPQLVVVPSEPPRLAWRVIAWPVDYPAEWEVLVDAHTGAIIQLMDLSTHRGGSYEAEASNADAHAAEVHSAASRQPVPAAARATGRGYVFDPNPLAQTGATYGGGYVDGGNADSPALTDALLEVDLLDITQGTDGLYRLEGPHVRIDGNVGSFPYTPPAEASPDGFRYTRSNDFFEAVNAYYHIDRSQRYVQSLDVGDIQNGPIRVNPHGLGSWDDSKYYTSGNAIVFGRGGVDDAEDADVVLHEYAHALLESSAPGLLDMGEGRAFHEGWADYWAASYTRRRVEAGTLAREDWRTLMEWDSGDGALWSGRTVEHSGIYPDDALCATSSCSQYDIYVDGQLWATTLMELWDALGYDGAGRSITDRLTLFSHGYLSYPVTMADAAQAILQADVALYDGRHSAAIRSVLAARGFVEADAPPVVTHEPLPATEEVGGTVRLTAQVTGPNVASVTVFYGYDTDAPATPLPLAETRAGLYAADLPLPGRTSVVSYYIEAETSEGLRTRLPEEAGAVYRFHTGPDAEPPLIVHEPLHQASPATWPFVLSAEVQDNLGIDSVWVTYAIEDATGTVQAEGRFELHQDGQLWQGTFPDVAIAEGYLVRYRILARDAAASKNVTALPETGTFDVAITKLGVVQHYDVETDAAGFEATGVWAAGTPRYGLRTAHSGERVWATAPAAAYPADAGVASLTLPALNLSGTGHTALVFWHWYDLEHNGSASPEADDASLWDGANVKISTDGGTTWTVLTPADLPGQGYTGTIEDVYGNPMGTERAFGGYSYGWRIAVFPLPNAADVRIRFDLGTDTSNQDEALDYAGWYLDDLSIVTYGAEIASVLDDAAAPQVVDAPSHEPVVLAEGQAVLPVTVQATDDVAIDGVWVDYEVHAAETVSGSTRLAMDPADVQMFAGTIVPPRLLVAGDVITYRIRVRDALGNETLYPEADASPLRAEVRLIERKDALTEVRPTGAWQQVSGLWRVEAGAEEGEHSSLVLRPITLPTNAEVLRFVLRHRYELHAGAGGNIKISTTDGATWEALEPLGSYPGVFAGEEHPMDGQPVFGGRSQDTTESVFDLQAYAGQEIRLRIDLGTTRVLEAGEFWAVDEAAMYFDTSAPVDTSANGRFDIPRTLKLHANYPDPFVTTTTLGYTLPQAQPVRLEVFDLLGRRVAVLVDQEQPAGTHTLTFDGSRLASGVYLLRFVAGGKQHIEQMVIAR